MIVVGLDDTDTLESRGTGHLAREIAARLSEQYGLLGVTRHQLLLDPRVPYTAKNSSAAILLDVDGQGQGAVMEATLAAVQEQVVTVMRAFFEPGSDPGLVVAAMVAPEIVAFGRRVQEAVVTQAEARRLAAAHGLRLRGLGGTEDGVIGALASVGLAASGDDGRYVLVGRSRELAGAVSVPQALEAGISAVRTLDGRRLSEGTILAEKLRPARRGGEPVLFVEEGDEHWLPLKLD